LNRFNFFLPLEIQVKAISNRQDKIELSLEFFAVEIRQFGEAIAARWSISFPMGLPISGNRFAAKFTCVIIFYQHVGPYGTGSRQNIIASLAFVLSSMLRGSIVFVAMHRKCNPSTVTGSLVLKKSME